MPTSFRSVAYGATRHRVVRHPGPKQQYVSAAQAAARGELAQGQPGMFGDTYGTNPASPGAGGSDVEGGLASSVGLTNPSSQWSGGPHAGPRGLPGSSLNDAFGAGTLLGALAGMSEAGRAVQALWNSQHPGPGGGMSNPFGVGQILYGRGTPGQWVSQEGSGGGGNSSGGGGSEPQSGSGRRQQFHAQSPASDAQAERNQRLMYAVGRDTLVIGAGILLNRYAFPLGFVWGAYWFPKSSGTNGGATKYPVGPGAPVSPSPLYPRVTPGQSGRPTVSLYMMQRFAEQLKRIGEQAHSRRGGPDGGGGTSTAPESLFFHGARHWYDVVAGQR